MLTWVALAMAQEVLLPAGTPADARALADAIGGEPIDYARVQQASSDPAVDELVLVSLTGSRYVVPGDRARAVRLVDRTALRTPMDLPAGSNPATVLTVGPPGMASLVVLRDGVLEARYPLDLDEQRILGVAVCDASTDCQPSGACAGVVCGGLSSCVETTARRAVCACPPGSIGDGLGCLVTDPCLVSAPDCGPGRCVVVDTATSCDCPEGYRFDGLTCSDIDECEAAADLCDPLARCDNSDGSFECTCPDGLEGDGFTCGDIDECAAGLDDCGDNAMCINAFGGFDCECDDGFEGDGIDCTPIEDTDTDADSDTEDDSDTDVGSDTEDDSDTDVGADSDDDTDSDLGTDTNSSSQGCACTTVTSGPGWAWTLFIPFGALLRRRL